MTEARNNQWLIRGGIGVVAIAIVAVFFVSKRVQEPLPKLKQVPDFALTNQSGKNVSLSDLRGKIWLAEIIFTRCAGPCPRMTKQFSKIQSQLPDVNSARLVTLTADPEFDTAEVLKKYGDRFGAKQESWWFLTGSKKEIYRLATDEGLMLSVQEKTPGQRGDENDLFVHSTLFVLVDQKGNVRAIYESTDDDVEKKVLADIKKLLREKS